MQAQQVALFENFDHLTLHEPVAPMADAQLHSMSAGCVSDMDCVPGADMRASNEYNNESDSEASSPASSPRSITDSPPASSNSDSSRQLLGEDSKPMISVDEHLSLKPYLSKPPPLTEMPTLGAAMLSGENAKVSDVYSMLQRLVQVPVSTRSSRAYEDKSERKKRKKEGKKTSSKKKSSSTKKNKKNKRKSKRRHSMSAVLTSPVSAPGQSNADSPLGISADAVALRPRSESACAALSRPMQPLPTTSSAVSVARVIETQSKSAAAVAAASAAAAATNAAAAAAAAASTTTPYYANPAYATSPRRRRSSSAHTPMPARRNSTVYALQPLNVIQPSTNVHIAGYPGAMMPAMTQQQQHQAQQQQMMHAQQMHNHGQQQAFHALYMSAPCQTVTRMAPSVPHCTPSPSPRNSMELGYEQYAAIAQQQQQQQQHHQQLQAAMMTNASSAAAMSTSLIEQPEQLPISHSLLHDVLAVDPEVARALEGMDGLNFGLSEMPASEAEALAAFTPLQFDLNDESLLSQDLLADFNLGFAAN